MRKYSFINVLMILLAGLSACEKNFDIVVKPNKTLLVVEGYINNVEPAYNYVLLSKSQDYYATDLLSAPVSDAVVTITEGTLLPDKTYSWDAASKTTLRESNGSDSSFGYVPGAYFDEKLQTDSADALIAKPGKYYLLEVEQEGSYYSAVTFLPPLVNIDSLSSGYYFVDEDDDDSSKTKARVTIHYQDPDTIGNTQLYYSRSDENRSNIGWGGLRLSRFTSGTDDLSNGQYMHLTVPMGFHLGEKVDYYLISVERGVYNFWDSYRKARNNGGPFSTPVTLFSNIKGENVTGCFSGFSISAQNIVVQ